MEQAKMEILEQQQTNSKDISDLKLFKKLIIFSQNQLKITLHGFKITQEKLDNFWKILKNIPENINEITIDMRNINLEKDIDQKKIKFFSFDHFPSHIIEFNFEFKIKESLETVFYENIMNQLVQLPKTINSFNVCIDNSFIIQLMNDQMKFQLKEVLVIPPEINCTFKDNLRQLFSNFSNKFNYLIIEILGQDNSEFEWSSEIYSALNFQPNNLKYFSLKNGFRENENTQNILTNAISTFQNQLISYSTQENSVLNVDRIDLKKFNPQVKYIFSSQPNLLMDKCRENIIYKLENNIGNEILIKLFSSFKHSFSQKSHKKIQLTLNNLENLSFNVIQLLFEQFKYIHSQLYTLHLKIQNQIQENQQHEMIISYLSNQFQHLPQELKKLKINLIQTIQTNEQINAFSNNLKYLPNKLKIFKLKIGNGLQGGDVINYNKLFTHIIDLPLSISILKIKIKLSLYLEIAWTDEITNCLLLLTKNRSFHVFKIHFQQYQIELKKDIKTLFINLKEIENLKNLFSKLSNETFYAKGIEKLKIFIENIIHKPTSEDCKILAEYLSNISDQFIEIEISIQEELIFGNSSEVLIMLLKLIDSSQKRALFKIYDANGIIFYQSNNETEIKLKDIMAKNQTVFENYIERIEEIFSQEKHQQEDLILDFSYVEQSLLNQLKKLEKFIYPKLKSLNISYQGCKFNDNQLPFYPSSFFQHAQSSNLQELLINLNQNQYLHNKALYNMFRGVYNWTNLETLKLYLTQTNIKSKGLNLFSQCIKSKLPNLKIFTIILNRTVSPYKLLASSIANLIKAVDYSSCPNLEIITIKFSNMRSRYDETDLKCIGDAIKQLSKSLKHITLDLMEMIGDNRNGIDYLLKSISKLENIEEVCLYLEMQEHIYDFQSYMIMIKSLKYFNSSKLKLFEINCESTAPEIDSNKMIVEILKQAKRFDLSKSQIYFSVHNINIELGNQSILFNLEYLQISIETYFIIVRFLIDLPPNIKLPEYFQIYPQYDAIPMYSLFNQ